MYANATVETGTGTGDTITLSGAVSGRIPFSASFADGDLVAYFIEDSGGSIMVAGVGTYNSPANTITRNDTWNYNGTVVDDTPSSNIALSSGSHLVRCDISNYGVNNAVDGAYLPTASHIDAPDNFLGGSASIASVADECIYFSAHINRPRIITNLCVSVLTADGTATISRAGIYSVGTNGQPDKLLASVAIDVTSTGIKVVALASPIFLPAGNYYTAFATDGTPTMRTYTVSGSAVYGSNLGINITVPRRYQVSENLTAWSDLPSSPNPAAYTENYPVVVGWS